MQPILDHIHITVEDLPRAERFYDALLPLIGFDLRHKEHASVPRHAYELIEYHHAGLSFGLVSPREEYLEAAISRRRPGAVHHIAFRTETREQVDGLYGAVCRLDAHIVHPPKEYPEYCKDYYAFFFKDTEGIEIEFCHFARSSYFPVQ